MKKPLFHIPLQFFAEDSGGDGGTAPDAGTATSQPEGQPNGEPGAPAPDPAPDSNEEVATIQQLTADNESLRAQLAALQQRYLSQEEQTRLELTQRETQLANREATLTDRENRLHAVHALESAGLCTDGVTSTDLMPFVLGKNAADIDSKVKSLQELLEKRETAQTEKFYRNAGRQPQQPSGTSEGGSATPAFRTAQLEEQKRAREIRERYTGGQKV